jgi:hypothetical protein
LRFFLASNIALALKARQKRSQAGALATTSKCGYTTHTYTQQQHRIAMTNLSGMRRIFMTLW